MRVINECPGAGRSHPSYKGRAGFDRRRNLIPHATLAGNTVIVPFKFDPVPVDGSSLFQAVHYLNFDGLGTSQNDLRSYSSPVRRLCSLAGHHHAG